jgi:hypothetical protein
MERFRTCDECSRHVRAMEAKCPFCGHALEAAALMPVPRAPAQLSRAQRIALVAAVAGGQLLAACGDDSGGNAVPVYGAPVPRAGTGVAGASAGTGDQAGTGAAGRGTAGSPGVVVPVYGAPVLPPAGSGGSAGKGGGAAGQAGASGSAAGQGGAGGAGGAAGKPAAAGSGGAVAHPVYGAAPAYGLPPVPPPEK